MEKRNEKTISIEEGFQILRKRLWLVVLIPFITTLISAFWSFYIVKPVYESRISVVIAKMQDNIEKPQYDINDIIMYQNLLKTYSIIAKSQTVAENALHRLGLYGVSLESFLQQISVIPLENTQIMDLAVRDTSPLKARDKVDAFSTSFIEEAMRIFPDGSFQVIDSPTVPKDPVSPNKKRNLAIAFILGLMISIGLTLLLELLDNTIKDEEDVKKYVGLPVLGIIPKNRNFR